MAHRGGKKTTGISRDARPKYLGVKLYAGQEAKAGSIIVRQRGSEILPGKNVGEGKDYTLFALKAGQVSFRAKNKVNFDGKRNRRKYVDIIQGAKLEAKT